MTTAPTEIAQSLRGSVLTVSKSCTRCIVLSLK